MNQCNGQPSTAIPLAVGQVANSQCSPADPHHDTLISSMLKEKYNNTPMNASPASNAADKM